MASIEVMKERARIAGRFNLSARRDPEHRALVALAAQRAGGECHVIPVAPSEDEAEVLRRARKVADGSPVIIVTEADRALRPSLQWRYQLVVKVRKDSADTNISGPAGSFLF